MAPIGYGQSGWGREPWGSPPVVTFRIELRNKSFELLDFLEDEASKIFWEYERIGGCGAFSFSLPRKFNEQGDLGGDYDIRIYKRMGEGEYELWYSGFIEDRLPFYEESERIEIKGYGYIAQLSRIIVNETYTNTEISEIVKSILDDYIIPNTAVEYDAADIATTDFTADSLVFKTNALNAIRTCAEIAGTREWGVGPDRKFFFKSRSSVVGFYYFKGSKVVRFSNIDSFRSIINRILIEGGDVDGSKFERTVNNTGSQTKYGLREQIVQNSAITSNNVADQYGNSFLAEKAELQRRAKALIVGENTRVESVVPLRLFVFREGGVRYGEEYYGTFLYSGDVEYQINKVTYKIRDSRTLEKTFDLGQIRPSMSAEIEQLSLELEQLRAART